MRHRASWIAAVALLWAMPAMALSLEDLAQRFARVSKSRATFEETKYVAALTEPLVRRGTLAFDAPGRLEMRVERPFPERVEIDGDALTIETRRGTSRTSLASQPLLAAWIESLRATLAGDVTALSSRFHADLAGDDAHWVLALTPLDAGLRAVVRRIEIEGAGAQISRYEIAEERGDRTVVRVTRAGDASR